MMWDVHLGSQSRIPDPDFFPSWIRIPDSGSGFFPILDPDPGFRGQKSTGSRIQIRNTACKYVNAALFFYREGKFKRLGLSNYSAWEVARTMEICAREGWLQPTVYQADTSPAVFFKRDSPARKVFR
jgi:hypothetical protein